MKTCDILIQNAKVMTDYETILERADIVIKDGKILAVIEKKAAGMENSRSAEKKEEWTAEQVIDGRNRLFMPGLTDSHMHT